MGKKGLFCRKAFHCSIAVFFRDAKRVINYLRQGDLQPKDWKKNSRLTSNEWSHWQKKRAFRQCGFPEFCKKKKERKLQYGKARHVVFQA